MNWVYRRIKREGFKGVGLFISDNHPGISHAIKKHFPGVPWQRYKRYFLVNAIDKVHRHYREQVHEDLTEVWWSAS